jgi:hypothetical protein
MKNCEFNKGLLSAMRVAHKVSKERRDGRKFGKQIAAWCENTALVIEERIATKWRVKNPLVINENLPRLWLHRN